MRALALVSKRSPGVCLGGLLALLAACQTAVVDPGASIVVDGEYTLLSQCYANSRPGAVTESRVARTGFRTVSVTSSSPSRAAAEFAADAQASGIATSYTVTFTEQPGYKTLVTGAKLGPGVVPFFWQDVVLPELRNCTGDPTLGAAAGPAPRGAAAPTTPLQ